VKRFEGQDLPQLMELMHDLARPEPVPWAPVTVGWWILFAWLSLLVLLAMGFGYKRWRRNRYRREALSVLEGIEKSERVRSAGPEIAIVLKRTALVAFPRNEVASLYGKDWAKFLCVSCDYDPAVEYVVMDLASAAYRRDLDGRTLIAAAKRWVEIHHD